MLGIHDGTRGSWTLPDCYGCWEIASHNICGADAKDTAREIPFKRSLVLGSYPNFETRRNFDTAVQVHLVVGSDLQRAFDGSKPHPSATKLPAGSGGRTAPSA